MWLVACVLSLLCQWHEMWKESKGDIVLYGGALLLVFVDMKGGCGDAGP